MSRRKIFHLSIPVSDLGQATAFYVNTLPGALGRRTESWSDVLVWGHQITLQLQPDEVLSLEDQGKRHFGFILEWNEWELERDRLIADGTDFLSKPEILLAGKPDEQAKMYLSDPDNHAIEIKTYRNIEGTLGLR